MRIQTFVVTAIALAVALFASMVQPANGQTEKPTYQQVNKILTKYCAGCHNDSEANGEFALHTFDALIKGGESGNAITAGSSASSRMIGLMRGKLEPAMPPDGEARPTDDEIQLIVDWIDAGAPGPSGESALPESIDAPEIESKIEFQPVNAIALSPNEKQFAVGRFRQIDLFEAGSDLNSNPASCIKELPGKITSIVYLNDNQLLAGTGVTGLYGEAVIIDLEENKIVKRFRGHSDMVYAIAISPKRKRFVTASYDRKAILWNMRNGKAVREFKGHNDSIFDCKFDQSGELLLTASADATVKIWRTNDGVRLDTRGEPLKEQYSVALSDDGRFFFAGGEDNRIRKWQLVSRDPNVTNPLVVARFAHESAIEFLQFHPDGKSLVSVASNGSIKIWNSDSMDQVYVFPDQSQLIQSLVVAKDRIYVGRSNGTVDQLAWPDNLQPWVASKARLKDEVTAQPIMSVAAKETHQESEPNNLPEDANKFAAPFEVNGVINDDGQTDVDHFKFSAKRGQRLIVETIAAKAKPKSTLDTKIAILDSNGAPVPRVLLQAVRDSYFTFRGKDSKQTGDFRIHNWEEMKLGQLLYCNGEVVKLYHYPRGPDSGYNVFPNFGNRHGMFDTTPITHALHEPCYVVEPHPPGTELPATGLPQFLLTHENDDDAERELGTDSRLTFACPRDGDYVVRVSDSRRFYGEEYKYTLRVRAENPGFKIKSVQGIKAVNKSQPLLGRGSYKKVTINVDRVDNFNGPINISVEGLPEGIMANGPITVEAGNLRAFMTIHATENAPEPAKDTKSPTVVATAMIAGKKVQHSMPLGEIKLEKNPKLTVELRHASDGVPHFNQDRLPVLEIRPGETITAKVKVMRAGHKSRINFGKEEATLNLPMGIYVSNTGLNGVLIPPGENERTFFIQAEDWVQPSERLIFLEAAEAGKPSSNPAVLRVLPRIKQPIDTRVGLAKPKSSSNFQNK